MPSVQELKSKNARAVHEKHLDLVSKYTTHAAAVEALHKLARTQIVDDVAAQLQLSDEGRARVLLYLSDAANLFRFYRRARYDEQAALALLNATVLWRMRTDLDLLSLASLNPLYVTPPPPNPPLFWVNSGFKDFYGRPCGVINLRSVERTAENTLDQLKEYIVACMEIMRRYVADLYRTSPPNNDEETVLQASIAVDLASSGMANLELELLPFLLDLLKNHVPGMVGAVYVLNYGWVHAGMWAVIKRVLPQQALAKIFFPSHDELKEHFDVQHIPCCYGGELDVAVDSSTNDVLRRYGRPRRVSSAPTPPHSPGAARQHMSRTNSYDSIYEVFYSADTTPWASRPITPRHSEPSTPRGDTAVAGGGLKMTPSAARKLKHLQMSRGDLSSAAEQGSRARSDSNPRIVDGRAVGLSVSVGASPFVTPSMTPVGPLSPRNVRTRNADRHVRFSSDRNRSSSPPPRRIGATTNNFTLYLPDDQEAVLPSESEDSDASGKDGVLGPNAAPASSSLLNRLRRLSETRFTSKEAPTPSSDDTDEPSMTTLADGTIMYIEPAPSSPHLQVPHLDEPPLQHVAHTFLSHRTRRSARDGSVSPYNANNPFFGYPAYASPSPSSSSASASTFKLNRSGSRGGWGTPQHLHARRRKRDLLRTLTYLFVLRILAAHRRLRWRVSLVWRELTRALSTGADGADQDDFWRNLDARRLSALHESPAQKQKNGGGALASVAKKLTGAAVVLLLLRPEWRQRTLTRVYSLMMTRAEEGGVNWDEWEKREVAPAKAVGGTRSGLHIREKLGLKAPATAVATKTSAGGAASGSGKSSKGSRMNAAALAGGLISAASLAYLLYTYLSSSTSNNDDDDVSRRTPTIPPPSHTRARPSLSLSLPPSISRADGASLSGLRSLLAVLAPLYVVHLIVPGSEAVELSESLASLAALLGPISEFDARRMLEYTQGAGRFALARALACDCHVEVALNNDGDDAATAAELHRFRRSGALVVFATFAQSDGSSVPPGMRRLELANAAQPWQRLAEALATLRDGWK